MDGRRKGSNEIGEKERAERERNGREDILSLSLSRLVTERAMLVLAAERAWDEGNEGLVKKGGETAADRGHGRRGEVAINKYTERTGGERGREKERERESGRSSHEEAREREKYRGMRVAGERKRRREREALVASVRPTVGPFLRPQSPHESNRRSFEARERKRERERKRDGERKRDRGIRYGS